MRMYDIISNKKLGKELTEDEIKFFVNGFVDESIPDYQVSALLMAIYFKKLNKKETHLLTHYMMNSGETIDLSSLSGIKVDKHSTGGVGDKTTIVLAPLVAAAGASVAKMSGRGIGHTGGTLDKLEAFSNIDLGLNQAKFLESVETIGIAVSGQTANLVPADKKLYALRDVTATVNQISLIASSIMSKKLASGSDAIVLDVKMGSGGFMETKEEAFELARAMVEIGEGLERETVAVITQMEEPLGRAVGNALEVKEAIATLQGNGPEDLLELCLELGANMLILAKKEDSVEAAKNRLRTCIEDGSALNKFKEFLANQGGNPKEVDDLSLLPQAKFTRTFNSPISGYVGALDALHVGLASMLLGAGRQTKESIIDLAAGIVLHKKIGESVTKDEPLATLYANDESLFDNAMASLTEAYHIQELPITSPDLIIGSVRAKDLVV